MTVKVTVNRSIDCMDDISFEFEFIGSLESEIVRTKILNEIANAYTMLDKLEGKDSVITSEDLEKDKQEHPDSYVA